MYLKLVALLFLTSVNVFAAESTATIAAQYVTCMDIKMFPFLTPEEKVQVKVSSEERTRIYTATAHRHDYDKATGECQRAQQSASIQADQQNRANTAAAAANAASGSPSGSTTSALATAGIQAGTNYLDSKKPSAPIATTGGNASTSTDAVPTVNASTTAASVNANNNSSAADKATTQPQTSSSSESLSPEMQQAMNEADAGNIASQTAHDIETARALKELGLGNQADNVTKTAQIDGSIKATETTITASAQAANAKLETEAKSLKAASAALPAPYFTHTKAEVVALQASLQNYLAAKKLCTESAERASFLCIEGSSPGVKAVNILMNAGGPVLAAISSAQKSCSSLDKVASIAGMGLAAAKAVCIGSKFMCDSSCSKAQTQLIDIQGKAKHLIATLNAELTYAGQQCYGNSTPDPVACSSISIAKPYQPIFATTNAQITTESSPTPGTTPAMALGCQGHTKDIAIMAVNVLGVIKARDSAKKCAQQLATSGNPTLTTQQYCEIPANVSTDLCKCQKDSTAAGCPNAVAANTANPNSTLPGVDIKNTGGVSQFASDVPVVPSSGLGGRSGDLGKKTNSGSPGLFGGGTSAGASDASGGHGGVGTSASDAAGDSSKSAKGASKKWWDFGSFGSLGDSGSSGSGKSSANGGAIGEKQMNAINRKIASDRFAAEVSSASGKSNWEKVKSMYLNKENSFIPGK